MLQISTMLAFMLSLVAALSLVAIALSPPEIANPPGSAAAGDMPLTAEQCTGYAMLHMRLGSAEQASDFLENGPCRFVIVPQSG